MLSAIEWASLVAQMVESACNAGDLGSTPGWGRSPGGGNGNPLQYACLENPVDGEAWRATVHGRDLVTEQQHMAHTSSKDSRLEHK